MYAWQKSQSHENTQITATYGVDVVDLARGIRQRFGGPGRLASLQVAPGAMLRKLRCGGKAQFLMSLSLT